MNKKVSLYYQDGGSDKVYHIQLEDTGKGYVVNFQYGRRGSTLKADTKTKDPVSLDKANKIYDSLLKEKTGKGYSTGETQDGFTGSTSTKKEVIMVPQLLNEIENVEYYIDSAEWLAQEKKDGERRIVISDTTIMGLNKKGTEVQLPDVIIKSFNGIRCVVDGEIIGDDLYVFDLLSKEGVDICKSGCRERIAVLKAMKFGPAITIVDTAYTPTEKNKLHKKLMDGYAEGIVFKNKLSPYIPGRPASGGNALKFKFVKTATFIVAESTTGKRSVSLNLLTGEQAKGGEKLYRHMGKVTIPANHEIPATGDLVEVRYLYAFPDGCIFQPVYLGKRTDCDINDAHIDQIIYKAAV